MLLTYFKIAIRNLKKNKAFALINIIGLSLGIACSILVFTLITFHLSFDAFHRDKERIFRLVTEFHGEKINYSAGVPSPLGKAFRNDFTFAEKIGRVVNFRHQLITIPGQTVKKFQEEDGIVFADNEFFEIMNFPLIRGNKMNAIEHLNTAIITEELAKKYFGSADAAMGQVFKVDNRFDFRVNGILANLPKNTDRTQQVYLCYDNLKDWNAWMYSDSSWGGVSSSVNCYVKLHPGTSPSSVNQALAATSAKYYNEEDAKVFRFKIQPLNEIHFDSRFDGVADKKYLWALALIGAFLVITACVNFVNLATAQALNRAREVGVRKVLGSLRSQLFWQFIAETALITIVAALLACAIANLALPALNNLLETTLTINFFTNTAVLLFLLIITATVVFLSGSYPGLVIARFRPATALKGNLSQKTVGGFSLRRVLVVTQFAISQVLIIGTIVIAGQMSYSRTSDLGFKKDAILMVNLPQNDGTKLSSFRNELHAIPGVSSVSYCYQAPAARSNSVTDIVYENRERAESWSVNTKQADDQYLKTFGLKLLAGRNLYPADTVSEFLVNETFVKKLGLAAPADVLGKMVTINNTKAPVVGVVNDFNNYSFREQVAPVSIMSDRARFNLAAVSINMSNGAATLAAIENKWNTIYPDFVYSSFFLDENLREFYRLDETMLTLVEVFAIIAIFIGCLGLYGLVSFMAVRKTREIGVRKVLGASLHNILWIFGKEFSRLLIVAFAIAAPFAWYVMNKYLEDFTYRIPFSPLIFLTAIGVTFVVAAATVGYQSLRSSLANPVKSLRTE